MTWRLSKRLSRFALALLVAGAWATTGCESQDPTFGRVVKHEIVLADFEDIELPGQERMEFQATVEADMVHPEFNVRWTNLNEEVVVSLYIVRLEDYDRDVPPPELAAQLEAQDKPFWTSATAGGQFGDPQTHMTVHPSPGNWVVFFFNPADAGRRTNIAELSAEVRLTHFSSEPQH